MGRIFQKKRQRNRCRVGQVHPKLLILTRPIKALDALEWPLLHLVLCFLSADEGEWVPSRFNEHDVYQIAKAIGNLNLCHWINQLGD
jgi:hypothetical protein